jgi:hypothetical protein
MKRQLSLLSLGFGESSGCSTPPEKRPAADSTECDESQPDSTSTTESQSLIPLIEPQTGPVESLSMSTESQTSAEPGVSPVSSFGNLSPPYDVGEVYDMASKLSNYER